MGMLGVYKIYDKFKNINMDIEGHILNGIFHFNRLKQAFLKTIRGPLSTQVELKQIINLVMRIDEQSKFERLYE